jgi:hypothetical protein
MAGSSARPARRGNLLGHSRAPVLAETAQAENPAVLLGAASDPTGRDWRPRRLCCLMIECSR